MLLLNFEVGQAEQSDHPAPAGLRKGSDHYGRRQWAAADQEGQGRHGCTGLRAIGGENGEKRGRKDRIGETGGAGRGQEGVATTRAAEEGGCVARQLAQERAAAAAGGGVAGAARAARFLQLQDGDDERRVRHGLPDQPAPRGRGVPTVRDHS